MQKKRGNLLPENENSTNTTEIQKTPVQKPITFNERSVSPWERSRNTSKDYGDRKATPLRELLKQTLKKPAIYPEATQGQHSKFNQKDGDTSPLDGLDAFGGEERPEASRRRAIPKTFEKQIVSARETYKSGLPDSNNTQLGGFEFTPLSGIERYNVPVLEAAELTLIRHHNPYLVKPATADTTIGYRSKINERVKNRETLGESKPSGPRRFVRKIVESEERAIPDLRTPLIDQLQADYYKDSSEAKSNPLRIGLVKDIILLDKMRQYSAPKGTRPVMSRGSKNGSISSNIRPPQLSNLRSRE